MLSHVATMLHVACALTVRTLSSVKNYTLISVNKNKEESIVITPLIMSVLDWFKNMSGLAWKYLKDRQPPVLFTLRARITVAELDHLVTFLSTAWTRSVIATVSAGLLTVLGEKSAALVAKTPGWSHIVSNSRYNASLVKKQLLGSHALRVQLANLIDHTSSLIGEIKSKIAPLLPQVTEDSVYIEASGALEAAETTMLLIAAVETIENHGKDAGGPAMAEQILDDTGSRSLPDTVKAKLKALLAKAS